MTFYSVFFLLFCYQHPTSIGQGACHDYQSQVRCCIACIPYLLNTPGALRWDSVVLLYVFSPILEGSVLYYIYIA